MQTPALALPLRAFECLLVEESGLPSCGPLPWQRFLLHMTLEIQQRQRLPAPQAWRHPVPIRIHWWMFNKQSIS